MKLLFKKAKPSEQNALRQQHAIATPVQSPESMPKQRTILDFEHEFSQPITEVVIDGRDLTIAQMIAVARHNAKVTFTTDQQILNRVDETYQHMMEDVRNGVPIYGCNTGYGAQASHVLVNGTPEERVAIAQKFSEGIVHVDIGTGPTFSKDVVRAAMLIRINMLLRGVSAVKLADLEIYRRMLNENITPIVNQYGGVGASGDLHHNGRVLSAARQLPGTLVWDAHGQVREAKAALVDRGIPPLVLDPKAGLGLVNGDNFSTALAVLLTYDTTQVFLIATVLGAATVEALKGTDRSFHQLLAGVRPHDGQAEVADMYRFLLKGSKLAYQEMQGHVVREQGMKVQDAYSLRGISQYHGVNAEKLKQIYQTIRINANAVSDNPLWVTPEFASEGEEPWHWVSGANFIAMHMVESMDALRKIMTQIVKLNDRHLARLVNQNENNGLPPNLSTDQAITHCTFKGVQTQSGMYEVYSSLLSIPVSTFFGVHEEMNQDITSHALTSGILGIDNLRLARYSTAQNLLSVMQAVDLRGGPNLLSPKTRPLYAYVRQLAPFAQTEQPLYHFIEAIYNKIENGELMQYLRAQVFTDFH